MALARERSDSNRDLRKQLVRVNPECDQAKKDLKEAPTCLRWLESQAQAMAVPPQADVAIPVTCFRGPHQLARRLTRPESAGARARPQARTVSTNHHQLGLPRVDSSPRVGPWAVVIALCPSPLQQR